MKLEFIKRIYRNNFYLISQKMYIFFKINYM